jgi:hypothetical protein
MNAFQGNTFLMSGFHEVMVELGCQSYSGSLF